MNFWLHPLGLTFQTLVQALAFWGLITALAYGLLWGLLRGIRTGRRRQLRERLLLFLETIDSPQASMARPTWPGDHGLILDEMLGLSRRAQGQHAKGQQKSTHEEKGSRGHRLP